MRISLSVLTTVFSLFGCAHQVTHTHATSFHADYTFLLQSVDRPENAAARFGAFRIDTLRIDGRLASRFEDSLVNVIWVPSSRRVQFQVMNKSDRSIRIPWDESALLGPTGISHRAIHTGIKYAERNNPQTPSVIARHGSIEDFMFPSDRIRWDEGTRYRAGEWVEEPMFPDFDFHSPYSVPRYVSFELFDRDVQSNVGKTVQVLLPLRTDGISADYIFTFRILMINTSFETCDVVL